MYFNFEKYKNKKYYFIQKKTYKEKYYFKNIDLYHPISSFR